VIKFIKELEKALIDKEIDIAVHSLKDMPGNLDKRFKISAVLERDNPTDTLMCKSARDIRHLKKSARVGTSAPRRISQILHLRPDIRIVNIRGSVETRMQKVLNGELDAVVLASCGIRRLGKFDKSCMTDIDIKDLIPSVGQGVVAVEVLEHNYKMINLCKLINHHQTYKMIAVEREYMDFMDADCSQPLGAFVRFDPMECGICADFFLGDIMGTKVRKIFFKNVAVEDISAQRAGEILKQAL
jgi:hydroxymethylbilane synthase